MSLRFVEEFEAWAATYDRDVQQPGDPGLAAVFADYERVLDRVATWLAAQLPPGARVADVGAGTGNLTRRLRAAGLDAVAVDPTPAMRRAAAAKLPGVPVLEGHFLALPFPDGSLDAIASSYAFHHLTDDEKAVAARELARVLRPGGVLALADVMFASRRAQREALRAARRRGWGRLADSLAREPYATVAVHRRALAAAGFRVQAERLGDWVWLLYGRRADRGARTRPGAAGAEAGR